MKTLALLLLLISTAAFAQNNIWQPEIPSFPLWPDGAPGALGKTDKDIPTLTAFLPAPEKATGAAIVICPGGGYGGLADWEGWHYARWLNELGIAGFVLKYRLGSAGYRHPIMLQDAARAVRSVRTRAAEWKLDPKRIGIIGSWAGGHLTSTLLTHFDAGRTNAADAVDRQSSRPDLGVLCYPVISTTATFTHQGSKANLLGNNPSPEVAREVSNELHVTKETPPCFIWATWEDKGVLIENSLAFAEALQKNDVRFELHIYERYGHGIGLGSQHWSPKDRHQWTRDCETWLKLHGFAK